MLAKWFDFMPLFVVKWFAIKYCERLRVDNNLYITARPDVLLYLGKCKYYDQLG